MQTNPVRTLESHGVEDQTSDEWHGKKSCDSRGAEHHMISLKTNADLVPYVEQCTDCSWIDGMSLNWWAENAIKVNLSQRAQRMALASDGEPFKFVQSSTEDLELPEVLGQALGAASTCWTEKQLFSVGEFDGARASAVFEALLGEVQRSVRLEVEEAIRNERARILNIVRAVAAAGSETPIRDILTLESEDRNPVNETNPSVGPAPLEAAPVRTDFLGRPI